MSVSVKIDNNLKDDIQKLAALRKRSPHWIMKEAITQYVVQEMAREKFKQEAVLSWKSYQETGHHLNHQEVQDWLKSWGTDQEKEAPDCHK